MTKKDWDDFDDFSNGTKNIFKKEKQEFVSEFWKPLPPQNQKNSKAYNAVIRILPDKNKQYAIELFEHMFWILDNKTGMRRFYTTVCPTSFNEKCPICEENLKLWNSGVESDKDIARLRKRRHSFVSNVYIIKHPGNPDDEGKVFLFKYGTQISSIIESIAFPEDPEIQEPKTPWSLRNGNNFILKVKMKDFDGGAGKIFVPDYTSSFFESESEFLPDLSMEENVKFIFENTINLKEWLQSKYVSYDKILSEVGTSLGIVDLSKPKKDDSVDEDKDLDSNIGKGITDKINKDEIDDISLDDLEV